ncbi:MAG: FmdB family zinc ribbon protein [Baekduia sp.]
MPIYEYRRPDGTTFEVMQRMTDDPLTKDPETGVPLERVFHPVAVHFKGKGFYNTDYGTKRRNRELRESAESGADKHDAKQAEKKEKAAASSSSSDSSSSAAAKPKAEKKPSSGSGSGDKKPAKK